jgi:hypothetical protein
VPTPDPVTVQAVSVADVSKSGASQVTIINHVLVTVLPGSALVVPLGVQPFVATVSGTDNQNVVWQIHGVGCSAAGICGAITSAGVYTAPGAAPTPDALQVVAISSEDPTQSGSANVAISTGVNIFNPASRQRLCGCGQRIHAEGDWNRLRGIDGGYRRGTVDRR